MFSDQKYWRELSLAKLKLNLQRKQNDGVARNVILFIGDGMGPSTVTAARIFQGQNKDGWGETSSFIFEDFSTVGLSKVRNLQLCCYSLIFLF